MLKDEFGIKKEEVAEANNLFTHFIFLNYIYVK